MSDPSRPAPQYGEYATPDQVAAARGLPVEPDPATHVPVTATAPTTSARPAAGSPAAGSLPATHSRLWDVTLTVGLLVIGFLWTIAAAPGLLDYSSTLNESAQLAGYAITFGQDADSVGLMLLLINSALLLGALGWSVARIRARKLSFWVPLASWILSLIAQTIALVVLMTSNPAYASLLLDRS